MTNLSGSELVTSERILQGLVLYLHIPDSYVIWSDLVLFFPDCCLWVTEISTECHWFTARNYCYVSNI